MLHTESLPAHQGIYTPLSQAMSDSESDEEIEIHNASKHQRQRQLKTQQQQQHTQQQQLQLQQQQQQQNQRIRNPPNTLALKSPHTRPTATRIVGGSQLKQQSNKVKLENSNNGNSNNSSSSYTNNMQNTFRSVMLSDLGGGGGGSAGASAGVEFSNFNGDYDVSADNVAILGSHTDEAKRLPMSTRRRCCFIASLLLCLFAVVGFVWIVPCGNADGTGACPAPVDRIKTHNWLNNYTRCELRGGVNVVAGLRAWENNLIFLYRGDVFYPEFRPDEHKRNGIISLIGSSGVVAWYDATVDEPVAIDCTLLDVDSNGKPDCLVIDEYGELGAINSASGQWHWRFMDRAAHKLDVYDFPLILPDIDDDGVLDILLISCITLEQRTKTFVQQEQQPGSAAAAALEARNVLRLLSGREGKPIGEGFRIHDCQKLSKLQLDTAAGSGAASAGTLSISYSCWRNSTELQRSKTLAELYALITNKSIVGRRLLPASKIAQHRRYGQRKDMDAQRNVYLLSGRELIVENRGKCPDCNVTLKLSETHDGRRTTLRNFTNSGMYGMVPAQWHFKNTKSKMSGFVIKFWKWHDEAGKQEQPHSKASSGSSSKNNNNSVDKSHNYTNSSSSSSSSTSSKNIIRDKDKSKDKSYSKAQQQQQKKQQQQQQQQSQRLKRSDAVHHHEFPAARLEFDAFDHLLHKRDASFHVPNHGKNQTAKPGAQMKNYKMQMITETVILVLFIGADTRIENTSQSNIVQFCRSDHNNENSEEMICQPDLTNQENSMLIADLDQDGSQELVSYMSTFVQDNVDDPASDWKLVSYVRLLRLQSELPAFYDQEKRN
ncbi:uncharacterized protein LOC6558832 [Drosophila grimshawi]|uniref:GH15568 n=1 Tax=Drosophila grimshawi TaxID=7222 RepID=B4J0Y9_DROGR|nr:uncharacterized protein LOC6558832 [Drosophila grimshawi]EDV95810.1 GH15568 [Drosophila grimshawi]